MKLQAVAAAMYTKGTEHRFAVSRVSGEDPDVITLGPSETRTFDPRDERSALQEYDRLMTVISSTAKEQRSASPRARLLTVFGMPPDFPVTRVAFHALQRISSILGNGVEKLRTELSSREDPQKDFELLGATVQTHANAISTRDSADVSILARRYLDNFPQAQFAPMNARQRHRLEILTMLVSAARAGDGKCLEILRGEAQTMGRSYAIRANLVEREESRYIHPHPMQNIGMELLGEFDLRERFAEGIRQITGWNFSMYVRLPGDVSNPAFTNVAAAFLRDQLIEETGKGKPGIAMLKR